MKIIYSRPAIEDVANIAAYIAEDRPGAAQHWIAIIKKRVRDLRAVPLIGRVVPEYERPDIREVFHGAYRIIYRVMADRLVILVVMEGHRQLTLPPEALE